MPSRQYRNFWSRADTLSQFRIRSTAIYLAEFLGKLRRTQEDSRTPPAGRLTGYEDVNDAERLSQDPTFRLIGSEKILGARSRFAFTPALVRDRRTEFSGSPQKKEWTATRGWIQNS